MTVVPAEAVARMAPTSGGLQSQGMEEGRAQQLADSQAAMDSLPGEFQWERPFGTGRMHGERVRLITHWRRDQRAVLDAETGESAAAEIERRVRARLGE